MIRRLFVPIALNQASTLVFGIIGITLVSHVVPERVYGAYGLFLTLTQVAVLLTHSPLTNHASRYWQREHLRLDLYARFLLGRVWRQTWPLSALLLAVTGLQALSRHDLTWVWVWPFLLASNLVMAFVTLATLVLNASERHWAVLAVNGTATFARAFLPVGMALLLGASLSSLSLGYALQAAAVGPVIVLLFRRLNLSVTPDPALVKQWGQELRDFGRPFMIMGVGGWLILNADRWVVGAAFGEQQLGLFNLASNMAATIPGLVCAGLLQWVFPAVFRASDRARTEEDWRRLARKCDQVTLLFLGLSIGGLCALHLLGPYLVGWLIGVKYAGSMPLLIPAGMAAIAAQTNQFQYLLLQGRHNSSAIVKIMLVLASIRTVGSLIAAAISWHAFSVWMLLSTVVVAWLGRTLIQRVALSNLPQLNSQPVIHSVRG